MASHPKGEFGERKFCELSLIRQEKETGSGRRKVEDGKTRQCSIFVSKEGTNGWVI